MITKKDIPILRQVFSDAFDEKFDQKFDQKFEEKFKTIIQPQIDQLKEDIVQFKDDILHEIVGLRDEVTIICGYRDMIEDHEQRLTKIEKHLPA